MNVKESLLYPIAQNLDIVLDRARRTAAQILILRYGTDKIDMDRGSTDPVVLADPLYLAWYDACGLRDRLGYAKDEVHLSNFIDQARILLPKLREELQRATVVAARPTIWPPNLTDDTTYEVVVELRITSRQWDTLLTERDPIRLTLAFALPVGLVVRVAYSFLTLEEMMPATVVACYHTLEDQYDVILFRTPTQREKHPLMGDDRV